MLIFKTIALALIFTGAIVMFISIVKYKKILVIVSEIIASDKKKTNQLYKFHYLLMYGFLVGYVCMFTFVYEHAFSYIDLMVGSIFFFGSLFVLIGIILQLRTFNTIIKQHKRVIEKNNQLIKTEEVTIHALANLAEIRDLETSEHIERTANYVKILATDLSKSSKYKHMINNEYIDNVVKSAPLHDIGKVGIPDSILKNTGKLNDEEFNIMKLHSTYGAESLRAADVKLGFKSFLCEAIKLTEFHHEKWDGSGYPNGFKGEEIPLSARIMALADVYDALRSKRCYKNCMHHDECRKIIKENSGTHFDPVIVQAFLNTEDEFKKISQGLYNNQE